MKVTKRGHDDWEDLLGKEISFNWFDGWDDLPYYIQGIFEGTQPYAEDPRYPRYYILVDGGGTSVWETEKVTVSVHG
jgi:hypothetical protein